MWLPKFLRKTLILRAIKKVLQGVLPKAATEEIMGGWKTWVSGLLGIATGLVSIFKTVADETWNFADVQGGIGMIIAGFGILGIGHKIEKGPTVK